MLRVGGKPRKTAPTHPPAAGVSSGRPTVRDASAIPCRGAVCIFRVSFFATLHCGESFGFRPGCLTLYLARIKRLRVVVSSSKSSHSVQHHTNACRRRDSSVSTPTVSCFVIAPIASHHLPCSKGMPMWPSHDVFGLSRKGRCLGVRVCREAGARVSQHDRQSEVGGRCRWVAPFWELNLQSTPRWSALRGDGSARRHPASRNGVDALTKSAFCHWFQAPCPYF